MRCLIIGTNIFPLPPTGYAGVEELVYRLSVGLAKKGHQITLVAPNGSQLPDEVEVIYSGLMEDEEQTWQRYKGRMEAGEFECVLDSSWQRWAVMSFVGKDKQIPVIQWHHTAESVYSVPAPVQYNLWVGLSQDHAARLGRHLQLPVRWIWNGIDTEFYKANGQPRGNRMLWVGRYMPEKDPLALMSLARKMRVGLDLFGDITIVSSQDYVRRCFQEADGLVIRANPGISRVETVQQYSTHKAMLFFPSWSEPFGLSTCEAMASGCVPIARRTGATPELIQHGITGFLVDTIEDMEHLIKTEAWKDINLEIMRKHVEKNFSLPVFVDRWEALLQDVINGSRW